MKLPDNVRIACMGLIKRRGVEAEEPIWTKWERVAPGLGGGVSGVCSGLSLVVKV